MKILPNTKYTPSKYCHRLWIICHSCEISPNLATLNFSQYLLFFQSIPSRLDLLLSFFLSFFLSTSLTSKGSTSLLLCFDLLLSSRNSFLSNRMRRLVHFGPKSSFLKLYFVQLLFFYISLHHKKELFFKKMWHPRPLFRLFSSFETNNSYNN